MEKYLLIIENLNFVYKPIFALILSLVLLIFHSREFKFLLNRNSIYLTIMLPVTILILTQTIATNLYLSLGLIGALSIVRYRTPVKSQYELAYLFALIAIGIVTGVNPKYSLYLLIILLIIPYAYEKFIKFFPNSISSQFRSFSDGRSQLNMVINKTDFKKIEIELNKLNLIRIDENNKFKECSILMVFDTLSEAIDFKNKLTIEPISISISNS
jgi:hypothetical protein